MKYQYNLRDNKTLIKARKNYGAKNQIAVVIEELGELICVLAKFYRYKNKSTAIRELYDRVVDEYADVTIVLEHVRAIFKILDKQSYSRINAKLERVERWLDTDKSFEHTTVDREVIE